MQIFGGQTRCIMGNVEIVNDNLPDSKILGLPVSRRMLALASRNNIEVDSFHISNQYAFTSTLSLNAMF